MCLFLHVQMKCMSAAVIMIKRTKIDPITSDWWPPTASADDARSSRISHESNLTQSGVAAVACDDTRPKQESLTMSSPNPGILLATGGSVTGDPVEKKTSVGIVNAEDSPAKIAEHVSEGRISLPTTDKVMYGYLINGLCYACFLPVYTSLAYTTICGSTWTAQCLHHIC